MTAFSQDKILGLCLAPIYVPPETPSQASTSAEIDDSTFKTPVHPVQHRYLPIRDVRCIGKGRDLLPMLLSFLLTTTIRIYCADPTQFHAKPPDVVGQFSVPQFLLVRVFQCQENSGCMKVTLPPYYHKSANDKRYPIQFKFEVGDFVQAYDPRLDTTHKAEWSDAPGLASSQEAMKPQPWLDKSNQAKAFGFGTALALALALALA
ncbi:hypothetical protein K438DRAFT_1783952 [Mycena galopus ATCC 62051]|nr:hypothetical protein K438DRAFT_1783952 [Mycena galopus ATCC 62051]